jgi:ppGpp synthetase/RelA/SpoT-type nucleotidyltranferase
VVTYFRAQFNGIDTGVAEGSEHSFGQLIVEIEQVANGTKELKEYLQRQVKAFKEIKPTYEVLTEIIKKKLTVALAELDMSAIVQGRAKTIASFAEKCVRKRGKYPDAVNMFDDLCGGRVIVPTKDDIEPVCRYIRRHFDIVEEENVFERLGVTEFGYGSIHFVVAPRCDELKEVIERFDPSELKTLAHGPLLESFNVGTAKGNGKLCDYLCQERVDEKPGARFRAEIQVRSILQHGWSEMAHDRLYKSDFEVPKRWKRIAGRVAATLEQAEEAFSETIKEVEEYKTYHRSYMTREQRRQELDKLSAVQPYDKDNRHLACQMARLAMSLEDWEQAAKVLSDHVAKWEQVADSLMFKKLLRAYRTEKNADKLGEQRKLLDELQDPVSAMILTDFGRALWKIRKGGRKYLEWATGLDPRNVSAHVFLAETCIDEKNEEDALGHYEEALNVSPSDPEVLAGTLYCKVRIDRNLDFVAVTRASLEAALKRCRARARVRICLPTAFYNMGFFALLLEKPYDSLAAYAKAVSLSDSVFWIESELRRIIEMQLALCDREPQVEWVRRFLMAAQVAKLLEINDRLTADIASVSGDLDAERKNLKKHLLNEKNTDNSNRTKGLRKRIQELETTLKNLTEEKNEITHRYQAARRKCQEEQLIEDASFAQDKIVLVAGGCDSRYEERIQQFAGLFAKAFSGFTGTVFSGCTDAGVNKLVGDLPARGRSIRKIAYVPMALPPWTKLHRKFKTVRTESTGFSVLDSIQNWIDMLAEGVRPSQVTLLGLDGGPIAGFEYRMAIAFGAKVGLLPQSGRATREIFDDEDWCDFENLAKLPQDEETLQLFVCGYRPSKALATHRDELARMAHEKYRQDQLKKATKEKANLNDWKDLPVGLKESNLQQIDHIEEKLRAVGLRIRHVEKGKARLYKLSRRQANKMAEMEHARWNVERLLAGWRFSEIKDVDTKGSPYLVPWADLPMEVKEWDYNAVYAIPEELQKAGYEIVEVREKTKAERDTKESKRWP